MSVSLLEKQQQLIAKYAVIEDPQERLAAIVAKGRKWPAPTPEEMSVAERVAGCMSQVWLVPRLEEGRCHFRMSADSPLVQGLAALICELYEAQTPSEIVAVEPEVLEKLGLAEQLSPTRLNGLANIRRVIQEFAASHV